MSGKQQKTWRKILLLCIVVQFVVTCSNPSTSLRSEWTHLSSATGDIPVPAGGVQQTASLVFDVDNDNVMDFVIANRSTSPSVVWYQRSGNGWKQHVIDNSRLDIEAGGAFHDIDGDGDLDIVLGGDSKSNRVWWWENPFPTYQSVWIRREIKNSGVAKHHDEIFGDFDGDGRSELVYWNQFGKKLYLSEIPSDPERTEPWPMKEIYAWADGKEHEGLAKGDIDGDGRVDIVGGGRWFRYRDNAGYEMNIIDDDQRFSRAAVGQLIAGGRPEVVFVIGDGRGPLKMFTWTGSEWQGSDLLGSDLDYAHSLQIADIDRDGFLDIFCAEMRLHGKNGDANMWILYGDGTGQFERAVIADGFGNHESRLADLDGDGDLDILGKPYDWRTPRVDVWLQRNTSHSVGWKRHVIDKYKPWRSLFITAADLDGDQHKDIITGGWWYRNPGRIDGNWGRHTIGAQLNNMALVYDFDNDGDRDILGTGGVGSNANAQFVWGRNDGAGNFAIQSNIEIAEGDFLQGIAAGHFQLKERLQIALSWHQADKGIQQLIVPPDPSEGTWNWQYLLPISQDEALSAADIDGDDDMDLLLGTLWLENLKGKQGGDDNRAACIQGEESSACGNGPSVWKSHVLFETKAAPDRNRLADIDGDGDIDAVVGYEAISRPGKLAWYERLANSDPHLWSEHVIAIVTGPMSLDVGDMDSDGDLDVVVGEHNTAEPSTASVFVFENVDGKGMHWMRHTVYTGDEHHDGTQIVDIDGDGDLDIISIGWTHSNVVIYENLRM